MFNKFMFWGKLKCLFNKFAKMFSLSNSSSLYKNIIIICMKSIVKYIDESLFKNQEQIKRMVKYKYTDFTDLGLSVEWAKCNLGAEKETDSGHYYMWGSITPNDNDKCCWENAPFNNGQNEFDKNYFNSIKYEVCLNGILASEYDVATQTYGDGYRMPTKKELDELISDTNNEWIENYLGTGINGRKFTNKSDSTKFIFIPAVGYRWRSVTCNIGINACVWSASLNIVNEDNAWNLYSSSYSIRAISSDRRYGFSVRPICDY